MKKNTEGIKTGVIKYHEKKTPIRIIQISVKSEIRNRGQYNISEEKWEEIRCLNILSNTPQNI